MENGKDEEDEALEDSFGEQTGTPVQLRNSEPRKPPPEGRAPTMTIEAVRVGRPKKVLSLLAAIISMILFVTSFASTSWVHTDSHRFGLLQRCRRTPSTSPGVDSECTLVHFSSPFNLKSWHSLACLIVSAIVLVFTLLGILFFFAGIFTISLRPKTIFYKIVLALHICAVLSMVACILLFPLGQWMLTGGTDEAHPGTATTMTVGWSFYIGCAGAVLLLMAVVLLATDRKSEEVVYKEIISRT